VVRRRVEMVVRERVGFEGMDVRFSYLGWRDDCEYKADGTETRR
jgi:hypothetical protein